MLRISDKERAELQNQRSGFRLFKRWRLSLGLSKQSLEKVV